MKFRYSHFLLAIAVGFAQVALSFGQEKGIADFPKLSAENDWAWWRGSSRNGHVVGTEFPTTLNDSNTKWVTEVPGRGHSSPCIVGDKVFLTTADEAKQILSIVAFDRATGKSLWKKDMSQGGFPEKNHPKNTAATPTIVSDGTTIYATFFHHKKIEVVATDFTGKLKWRKDIGPFNPKMYEYGYAPSPLVYKKTLIVAAEHDGESYIAALNLVSGKEVWRTPRPQSISFSSPVVAHVSGRDQLLISGINTVSSYDPNNGKPLWSTPGTTAATCGTMVWDGDIVFASGGYPKAETLAVKSDGSGTVLWRNNQKCYEQSMIATNGYLYGLTDNGVLYCWKGSDGTEMWKQRLQGPVSASPILVGDNIYWANEAGTMYVFKANPEKFELVVENQVGDDAFASPAAAAGEIFLRVGIGQEGNRTEALYCFGSKN